MQANNSYDRSYDGAGLGLSVVKGLAKLHGGKLELTSTLGSGTTASILLPLDSASESVEAPDAQGLSRMTGPRRWPWGLARV